MSLGFFAYSLSFFAFSASLSAFSFRGMPLFFLVYSSGSGEVITDGSAPWFCSVGLVAQLRDYPLKAEQVAQEWLTGQVQF